MNEFNPAPFFACLVISANFFCCDCLKSMRFNGGAAHVFVVGYIVNHHFFSKLGINQGVKIELHLN